MILVDSSAWVEFDRATGSTVDQRLTSLIAGGNANTPDAVGVTEPVLMEVLAGARDAKRHDDLRRLLTSFEWVPSDAVTDFEAGARIYRSCRAAGLTPRRLVDCMIAGIAIRSGARLLAADQDFEQMATVVPLQLDIV